MTLWCVCDRDNAVASENERLKLKLLDRERDLTQAQHSLSTLEHRLAQLALNPATIIDTTRRQAENHLEQTQLGYISQIIRNIAQEVRLSAAFLKFNF